MIGKNAKKANSGNKFTPEDIVEIIEFSKRCCYKGSKYPSGGIEDLYFLGVNHALEWIEKAVKVYGVEFVRRYNKIKIEEEQQNAKNNL